MSVVHGHGIHRNTHRVPRTPTTQTLLHSALRAECDRSEQGHSGVTQPHARWSYYKGYPPVDVFSRHKALSQGYLGVSWSSRFGAWARQYTIWLDRAQCSRCAGNGMQCKGGGQGIRLNSVWHYHPLPQHCHALPPTDYPPITRPYTSRPAADLVPIEQKNGGMSRELRRRG
jgi:hypothetical protein